MDWISPLISLFHMFCCYTLSIVAQEILIFTHSTPLTLLWDSEYTSLNDKGTFWAMTWQLHCLWIFYCSCFYFYKEVWKKMNVLLLVIRSTVSYTFIIATEIKVLSLLHVANLEPQSHPHWTQSVHWHSIIREKNGVQEHEQNTGNTYQRLGTKGHVQLEILSFFFKSL